MREETTLYDYWLALYRRKLAILIVTISSAVFSIIISELLTPIYEARSVFYVPLSDDTPLMPMPEEKAAGLHLGVIKGGEIMAAVLKQFPDKTVRYLRRNVDFVMSEYFMTEVYVRDENPEVAAAIANYYPVAYRDFHLRYFTVSGASNPGVEVVVTERASAPKKPAFPQTGLNFVVSLLFGFTLGCYYALLLDYLSRLRRFRISRELDLAPINSRINEEAERS